MAELDSLQGAEVKTWTGVVALRLPRFTPEHVAALNALLRPRPPLSLTLGGQTLRLAVAQEHAPSASPMVMGISIGTAPARLHLSPESLEMLTAHLPLRAGLDACCPDQRALWLEYALLEWIEFLEARLAVSLQLLDEAPSLSEEAAVHLPLRLESDAGSGCLVLSLDSEALQSLSPLLASLGPPVARPWASLPMPVQWIAGYQMLSLGELRDLAPGDVVLLERPGRAVEVAERLLLEVEERTNGLRLLAVPVLREGGGPGRSGVGADNDHRMKHRSRDAMAEVPRKPLSSGPEETALDRLPIRLVCELGRMELTLGELRELDKGSVLPLARPAEEAVDILANGRYVGKGRVVAIGDSLGVQIVRLTGDE